MLTALNITDDDAKARAAMRGVRITATSINGARNLLAKRETAVPSEPIATPATQRPARQRRERAPEPVADAESLIKAVVGKLQAQGNAQAELFYYRRNRRAAGCSSAQQSGEGDRRLVRCGFWATGVPWASFGGRTSNRKRRRTRHLIQGKRALEFSDSTTALIRGFEESGRIRNPFLDMGSSPTRKDNCQRVALLRTPATNTPMENFQILA